MKICLLSNVNCDLVVSSLKKNNEVFDVDGYGQWVSYALSPNQELVEFNPKFIILLLDGNELFVNCLDEEGVKAETSRTIGYISTLAKTYSNSTIIVSSLDFNDKRIASNKEERLDEFAPYYWKKTLSNIIADSSSIVEFDLKRIIDYHGRKAIYADNMLYMGSIPFSIKGTTIIAESIQKLLNNLSSPRKKVLALDLDNTLWGGVIGEDGPNNIVLSESNLGRAYRDAQKRIKEIGQTGVLLAVVSKNNPEDADLAFNNNHFMVLQKSDFISIKCNWETKSKNLIDLANELNVGMDSIVFLDDNVVEREEVRQNASAVNVVDFPKDVANLPNCISQIYEDYFWINSMTKEDIAKKKQYEENISRNAELNSAASLEDYLLGLNIDIVINEIEDSQKERVVQLINKTNQFNTNTLRLDAQQLNDYLSNNGRVFVANVSDKYGDSGLVVIMLVSIDKNTATIDNFLMSCRVMSRQIENAFVYAILDKLKNENINIVRSSYLKSPKNKPVESLYEKLGFKLVDGDENNKSYSLQLDNLEKPLLAYRWK